MLEELLSQPLPSIDIALYKSSPKEDNLHNNIKDIRKKQKRSYAKITPSKDNKSETRTLKKKAIN